MLGGPVLTRVVQAEFSASRQLVSTTEEVIGQCPWFHILVIGNSGIGKSTLMIRTFGIERAEHNPQEKAEIETELVSPLNDRLRFHVNRGFESGDQESSNAVEDFIRKRRDHPDITKRLHAIWLCFEVPLDDRGGPFISKTMESFLARKQDIVGTIPVIFVFTKLDKIIDHFERKYGKIVFLVRWLVKRHLQRYCLGPIARAMKDNKFQHVAVTKETDLTAGYWDAIFTSLEFLGHSIAECLLVIHTDMVGVWNFRDPHRHLMSSDFQGLMIKMIEGVGVSLKADPEPSEGEGEPFLPLVIAFPLFVGATLVQWLYSSYRRVYVTFFAISGCNLRDPACRPGVQQRFIAYIVDLTHVMTILFSLTANNRGRVLTRRTIQIAFNSYFTSALHNDVHREIKGFHRALVSGKTTVLKEIERLLRHTEK
ncbi:hypothetical protein ID866_8668, partial [Astraeus odoratus]